MFTVTYLVFGQSSVSKHNKARIQIRRDFDGKSEEHFFALSIYMFCGLSVNS